LSAASRNAATKAEYASQNVSLAAFVAAWKAGAWKLRCQTFREPRTPGVAHMARVTTALRHRQQMGPSRPLFDLFDSGDRMDLPRSPAGINVLIVRLPVQPAFNADLRAHERLERFCRMPGLLLPGRRHLGDHPLLRVGLAGRGGEDQMDVAVLLSLDLDDIALQMRALRV
jgi:hypothetical protein